MYTPCAAHIKRLDLSNARCWLKYYGQKFESDKEQVDITTITDTLYKLKANRSTVTVKCQFVLKFVNLIEFYRNILTVQLALRVK
jgi:hypothetical protein